MLTECKMMGFVPTNNPERSKDFYQNRLGLKLSFEDPFAIEFAVRGNRLRVVKTAGFEPFPFTILGWEVDDLEKTVGGLREKDVRFEFFPGLKQSRLGIWDAPSGSRVAWFKDPDGN